MKNESTYKTRELFARLSLSSLIDVFVLLPILFYKPTLQLWTVMMLLWVVVMEFRGQSLGHWILNVKLKYKTDIGHRLLVILPFLALKYVGFVLCLFVPLWALTWINEGLDLWRLSKSLTLWIFCGSSGFVLVFLLCGWIWFSILQGFNSWVKQDWFLNTLKHKVTFLMSMGLIVWFFLSLALPNH